MLEWEKPPIGLAQTLGAAIADAVLQTPSSSVEQFTPNTDRTHNPPHARQRPPRHQSVVPAVVGVVANASAGAALPIVFEPVVC